MNRKVYALFETVLGVVIWCAIWIELEILIYGTSENRLVDNIITIIVIPIIYFAVLGYKN